MVKKLFLAMMMVLAASTTVYGAIPDATQPGGFYIDDVKFTTDNFEPDVWYNNDWQDVYYVDVPFKAWFSFPASFCHLQVTTPKGVVITLIKDEETGERYGYLPNEDFTIDWINVDGNPVPLKWELAWGLSEIPAVDGFGNELNVYNIVIYNTIKEGAVWNPVSWAIPSEHYKMFTLRFGLPMEYYNENLHDIGDIEITSFMVNYANVVPWCPFYNENVHWDYARTYEDESGNINPCGDANGDGEIIISDMYELIDDLLIDYHDTWRFGCLQDVNEDGSVDIIDLEMVQEAIFEGSYDEGWWYKGHTIEVGHSKAKATMRHSGNIAGDINGDGVIDVGDVVELNDGVLNGKADKQQDLDGDGQVDVSDVVNLISIILFGRTPMPEIEVEEHSNYYLITATGNGEVLLYIDGEPVNNPYYLYFGNEEQLVHITATAREGQKAISETASRDLYVPANW